VCPFLSMKGVGDRWACGLREVEEGKRVETEDGDR
jgi:hypothetical protein